MELRRSLGVKFILLILFTLALSIVDSVDFLKMVYREDYIGDTSFVIAWLNGMGMSMTPLYMFVAPAVIALVYIDTLWVDRNTTFMNYVISRSSDWKYIHVKYAATLFSGGLIAALPCILLYILFSIAYPLNYTRENIYLIMQNVDFFPELLLYSPLLYLLLLSFTKFSFGMAYTLIGLSVSALSNNRYIALSVPYMIYLLGTYFGYPYFVPASTFTPNAAGHPIDTVYIFKDFGIIAFICTCIYYFVMPRKCKQ
ncbi:hypothetical protein [Paenibacillus turpanensis]|uniref:hypothetical protein n=1 Tax=Paenibacillus turpanensis TaxID=2689078 RepID=UPI001408B5D4|nr:hypothetical protein [Paenibacillus turpanensis]